VHVHAARIYASTNQQRAALVELEEILSQAITAVADSAWQATARSTAAHPGSTLAAESMRRYIDEAAGDAQTTEQRKDVEAALLRGYGEHLEEVALATSSANVSPCMKDKSEQAYLFALKMLKTE